MGRGKAIGEEAREIIYRVYVYCSMEAEKFKIDDNYFQRVQRRTADATGVSLKYIYRLVKEKGKYGSDAFKKGLEENSLKRKLDSEECNANVANDQIRPDIESVFVKPDPVVIKVHKVQQRLLPETVVTTSHPDKPPSAHQNSPTAVITRPAGKKVHQIHRQTEPIPVLSSPRVTTPVLINAIPRVTTPASTNAIPQLTIPASINAIPPLIRITRVLPRIAPKPTINVPQCINPRPANIKVNQIPQNSAPQIISTNVPNISNPGPAFVKVYRVTQNPLSETVLKTPQSPPQQNIEIQTVPIQFDPGSVTGVIKIEPADSISD